MKASNLKALRHTSTELLDLASTESLQTQLERIEVIPYITIPTAKEGDKIFLHAGDADLAPTGLPADGVYTIEGIKSVGNNYRQTLICTLDAE